ncbi:MAG TPA: cupredoxin domain-containing protein, partial [Gemmatimonadales bacterium]|nr:cupredoxin domain-containing protein [Gemmatimonadales bacterium]
MTALQLVVTLGGVALILLVNWYFFASHGPEAVAAAPAAGPQKVRVTVDGGYSPARIEVRAGRPVTLEFDRRDRGSCT